MEWRLEYWDAEKIRWSPYHGGPTFRELLTNLLRPVAVHSRVWNITIKRFVPKTSYRLIHNQTGEVWRYHPLNGLIQVESIRSTPYHVRDWI